MKKTAPTENQTRAIIDGIINILRESGPMRGSKLESALVAKNDEWRSLRLGLAIEKAVEQQKISHEAYKPYMLLNEQITSMNADQSNADSTSDSIETDVPNSSAEAQIDAQAKKPIRAYGLYWERSKVIWGSSNVALLAIHESVHKKNPTPVNLSNQKGIYILYDGREVVYVGRTVNTLGNRLRDHTRDSLQSRWNRFSWFGFASVDEKGDLKHNEVSVRKASVLAGILEAVLITCLEPPLNWRSGDHLTGKEYIQVEDPELVKNQAVTDSMKRLLELQGSK